MSADGEWRQVHAYDPWNPPKPQTTIEAMAVMAMHWRWLLVEAATALRLPGNVVEVLMRRWAEAVTHARTHAETNANGWMA